MKSGCHLSTRQYARLVDQWVCLVGLDPAGYGTHSLRRTKVALLYKKTGNLPDYEPLSFNSGGQHCYGVESVTSLIKGSQSIVDYDGPIDLTFVSPPGGSMIIAGAGAAFPPCIKHLAIGGAGGTVEVRDHRNGHEGQSTRVLPPGPVGTVSSYPDIEAALATNPVAAKAASLWIIQRLESLRLGIYAAWSGGDDRKVLELFQEYLRHTRCGRINGSFSGALHSFGLWHARR
jgi:hypothetical protein